MNAQNALPFHSIVQVPVLNGGEGETILLKDLVYNFVYDAGPIHAIDNMDNVNENCNTKSNSKKYTIDHLLLFILYLKWVD